MVPPHLDRGRDGVESIIAVDNLTKTYASGFQALKGVSLQIRRGEIFALLGPNGAGKTTLISIVCGLVNPTGGQVLVDGFDNRREYRQARKRIGLVPQELTNNMFDSVWATVRLSRGLFGKPRNDALLEQILRELSLWDKRNERIMDLSGGMKRRVLIAKALAHEPEVLFLDEPTNGMDPKGREEMLDLVTDLATRKGVNLILSSHLLPDVEETCERVIVLHQGTVATEGAIAELKQRRSQVFEIRIKGDLETFIRALEAIGAECHGAENGTMRVFVPGGLGPRDLFGVATRHQVQVRHLRPSVPTLEDVFAEAIGE